MWSDQWWSIWVDNRLLLNLYVNDIKSTLSIFWDWKEWLEMPLFAMIFSTIVEDFIWSKLPAIDLLTFFLFEYLFLFALKELDFQQTIKKWSVDTQIETSYEFYSLCRFYLCDTNFWDKFRILQIPLKMFILASHIPTMLHYSTSIKRNLHHGGSYMLRKSGKFVREAHHEMQSTFTTGAHGARIVSSHSVVIYGYMRLQSYLPEI